METRKALISPGYGAGWSTWGPDNHEIQHFMVFHKGLIEAIEKGEDLGTYDDEGTPLWKFAQEWFEEFPGERLPYGGGTYQLEVVKVTGQFRIEEYDGHESIEMRDYVEAMEWL
jgi:hypothetical protein